METFCFTHPHTGREIGFEGDPLEMSVTQSLAEDLRYAEREHHRVGATEAGNEGAAARKRDRGGGVVQ